MQNFKKIIFLLTYQERRSAFLLLLMIIIMALLDMIGVASILPFMAVLTNPNFIEENLILNTFFKSLTIFGLETNHEFTFALGILVFILIFISLAFKALTTYAQVHFVWMREYSIGKRLIEGYLHQSYDWFLSRHSANLGKNILSEVQGIILNAIAPLMVLISQSAVAIGLIILLVLIDPKISFIVAFLLGTSYLTIFNFIRVHLKRIGIERLKSNQSRFAAISQAFGAVKEIKVRGLEQIIIKKFSNSAKIFARTQASSQVISLLPRFILEAIALGGILIIVLYVTAQTGSFDNALLVISIYVFAGYRLMPALQQIYASIALLTFVSPSLDKLYYDLKNLKSLSNQDQKIIKFKKTIVLKNVYYSYPNSERKILNNINLIIPAKSTVGLVGATGSGKTTIVDIIIGLLVPQRGILEVDGKVITKNNSRSWQHSIGYVPQHIYLSDDTVVANIAFGVEPKDVNQEVIEKVSKIANLHNFIIQELPNKYQTIIGEHGARLSGGQRQRIGIARALYHNPQLLILDEATSALDNQTEKIVMDAINNLKKRITIILIAHRLNTVKDCDQIFLINKGKIKKKVSFEQLNNNV